MTTGQKCRSAARRLTRFDRRWVAIFVLGIVCMLMGSTGAVWSQPDCEHTCNTAEWDPFWRSAGTHPLQIVTFATCGVRVKRVPQPTKRAVAW